MRALPRLLVLLGLLMQTLGATAPMAVPQADRLQAFEAFCGASHHDPDRKPPAHDHAHCVVCAQASFAALPPPAPVAPAAALASAPGFAARGIARVAAAPRLPYFSRAPPALG